MENPRFLSTWILGMAAFFLFAFQSLPAGAYTILTPPVGKKIQVHARRAEAYMVIKAKSENEARSLKTVRLVNAEGDVAALKPSGLRNKDGAYYVHYLLPLKNGRNTFVVSPGDRVVKIRYRPMMTLLKFDANDPSDFIFHRQDVVPDVCAGCHNQKLPADSGLDVKELQKNSDFSPVCYSCHRQLVSKNKWLHGPAANVSCMTCHRNGNGKRAVTMISGRVDEICYKCHINERQWKTKVHVHGPVGIGDCTVCHDPHSDKYEFQLWADPKIDLCIACHTEMKKVKQKIVGFHPHGIINGCGCKACHDPHASDNRFQLYKPINELCVGCHIGLKGVTQGHPVGKHPLSGKKDPRRKGRELSCSSCHDPHGSKYKSILIGSVLGGHVCSKCHH